MTKDIAVQLSIYAGCIAVVSQLWQRPFALLAALVFISAAMLWKWHSRMDLAFYALAFFLGPVGEAVAVWYGVWEYGRPLLLVPVWLPFLWGIVAMFMRRLAEAVVGAGGTL